MGEMQIETPGERHSYSDSVARDLLAQYSRTRDQRLRDQIVEHMRPLVLAVARKFAGREPLDDLESEGFVGLIRAVDRFCPDKGARFSTFATHLIAGQIRHYLRDRGHLIRQPAWLQELNGRVQKISAELEQRLERQPSVEEIAAAANLSEEGVEELLAARQAAQVVRMESPQDGCEDDYLEVDPEKFRSRDYVTLQLPIEDRVVLENALVKLKDLEQKVLHYFFYQDCNQSEIARKLGISCNYAGYVLRNGLKHMRERMPQEAAERRRLDGPGDESVLDGETGVYNREYFRRRLREEISRAQRYDGAVSVCCLRLPPDCSEAVLQAAVAALRRRTRKADVIARTADREFGLIFHTNGTVAAQVSHRLAELIQQDVEESVQAASASFPADGRTADELYDAARASGLTPVRLRPALAEAGGALGVRG